MDRKLTLRYILWTLLFSLLPWALCVILAPKEPALCWLLLILGCLGPAAASFTVTRSNGIVSGFGHWLSTGLSFRLAPGAWALPLACFAAFAVSLACFGYLPKGNPALWLLAGLGIFGLGELGWRHVLQSLASIRMGFFLSVSLGGIIWFVWSVPMTFLPCGPLAGASTVFTITLFLGATLALGSIRHVTRAGLPCVIFATLWGSWLAGGAPDLGSSSPRELLALAVASGTAALVGLLAVALAKKYPGFFRRSANDDTQKKKSRKKK